MADISNLKINERANVERPNLWESLQYKMKFISKGKIKIGKITNGANGRTIPKFPNFWNFDNFPNQKENWNSKNI